MNIFVTLSVYYGSAANKLHAENLQRGWEACFHSTPAEVHSLPASFVTEGRLPRITTRPVQHNLIYYLRFCFRLASVNAIVSNLMNCIKGVDHF